MAGHRKRIGAAAIALAVLGLAGLSAWGAFVQPSRQSRGTGATDPETAAVARAIPSAPGGDARGATDPGATGSGPTDPGATAPGAMPVADGVPGASPGPATAGTGELPGAEHATDEERRERDRLGTGMAKLVRDLEWSTGLKEPPQQLVEPQPEPWRRDPSREGPSPRIESIVPRRARAAGGDRVTIRGRDLRVVQVMFGAAPARLLAARGTEVIVETPPGPAGPVTVAVTNDDGTWAIATEPFVYGE